MTVQRFRFLLTIRIVPVAVLVVILVANFSSAGASITARGPLAQGTPDRLEFLGGVSIELGDWVIKGQSAVYDMESGSIHVRGDVELRTADSVFTAQEASYTESDGSLVLDKGRFISSVADSDEPVYFIASRIEVSDASTLFDQSIITTCDLERPHWYLKSKTVELWPSDRVVLHSVTLWEFGVPLFYWPRLTLPLQGGSLPQLPKIGYTASTGLYLLIAHAYGDKHSGGTMNLDLYQRTGFGAGIEHLEELSDRISVEGSAYLFKYWGADRYWARLTAGLSAELIDGFETTASVLYKPEVVTGIVHGDEVQLRASIGYSQPHTRVSVDVGLIGSTLPQDYRSHSLEASVDHRISDRIGVEGRIRRLDKTGRKADLSEVSDTLTNYTANARYRTGTETVSLTVGDWTETTESYYAITRKERLVRSPELSLTSERIRLPWSSKPLTTQLSIGDYGYSPSGSISPDPAHSDWRVSAEVSQTRTSIAESVNASLWYSIGAGYRYYGSGAESAFVSPKVGTEFRSGSFTVSLTRSLTAMYGHTPLVFDSKKPEDKLTARASYASGHLTASIQSSVDLCTDKMDPVALWLRYSPAEKLAVDLSYRYDVVSQTPYSAIVRYIDQRDEQRLLRLGVDYSLVASAVSRAEAEIGYKLTDQLKLVTAISYDGSKKQWNRGDMALVADLHCREVSLRYDVGRRQVWLEYRLLAFPGDPIKVGLDEDEGVLLDSSIFSTQ